MTKEPERKDSKNDAIKEQCEWVDAQGCDAESLVELTQEMSSIFLEDQIDMDDYRCFSRLCVDMALHFQTIHNNTDWDNTDFVREIEYYSKSVKAKLLANPEWINIQYKWMYGRETVTDLLAKR